MCRKRILLDINHNAIKFYIQAQFGWILDLDIVSVHWIKLHEGSWILDSEYENGPE